MCTLLIGLGVLGPGTLVLGANRDESPDRATEGPGVLVARPRIVGGRDLVAGGTWLAVREGRFVSALMNRRPLPGGTPHGALRSRGLLCLDAAAAGPALDAPSAIDPGTGEPHPARLTAALRLIGAAAYGHCTLVGLDARGEGWAIHAGHGGTPAVRPIEPGWHVLTHQDLDDPDEPRTRELLARLRAEQPRDVDQALERMAELLRGHGENGEAPVCLHRDRFPTVSSSLLALGMPSPRYLHAAGPPCVTQYADHSDLIGSRAT